MQCTVAVSSRLTSGIQVPLQYSDPNAGAAAVALIMLPSNVSHDDPSYLGPLLVNSGQYIAIIALQCDIVFMHGTSVHTGGPGGSGVQFVLEDYVLFEGLFGPNYDIVGFDPRGIARSR